MPIKLPTLPTLPNPWLILGVLVALLTVSGISYWKGGQHARDAIYAEMSIAKDAAEAAAEKVAAQVTDAVAAHKGTTQKIYTQGETIVKENTIYKDCKIDADMQELIRKAGERSE